MSALSEVVAMYSVMRGAGLLVAISALQPILSAAEK